MGDEAVQPAYATYQEWVSSLDSLRKSDHWKANAQESMKAQGGDMEQVAQSFHHHDSGILVFVSAPIMAVVKDAA